MREIYRTRALVLDYTYIGEFDVLLFVWSRDMGKLEVLGRALRKLTSKLRSSVPLFSVSDLDYVEGKNFKILTGAELVYDLENLKNNVSLLKKVTELVEFLKQWSFVETGVEFWEFQRSFWWQVENKKKLSDTDLLWLEIYFKLKTFELLGYLPDLSYCSVCNNKIYWQRRLYLREIERVCKNCKKGTEKELSLSVLSFIRRVQHNKLWPTPQLFSGKEEHRKQIYLYLKSLERKIRSLP